MDVKLSFQIEEASMKNQSGDLLYSFNKTETAVSLVTKKDVAKEESVTVFLLSNLATKAAVDIVANGAEHDSKGQGELIQHSRGKPLHLVNQIFPLTIEFLTQTGIAGGPKIKYTTAIWVDRSVELEETFNKVIRETYKSDLYSQEFTKKEDLKREVNGWVKEKTRDLIEDCFGKDKIEDNTRLILAAALDFEGEWFKPFQDEGVQKFEFLSGEKVDMQFMSCQGKHYVKRFKNYKVLSIAYKQHKASRFSMLFYLPDNKDDIYDIRRFIGDHEAEINPVYFADKPVEVGKN